MGCSFNPHRVVTEYMLLMLVCDAENKESIRPVCCETEWAQIVVMNILFRPMVALACLEWMSVQCLRWIVTTDLSFSDSITPKID